VSADGPFGRTDGVINRIEITASPLGTVDVAGPGAGGAATSSAVLADLVAVARGLSSTWAGLPAASGQAGDAAPPFDHPQAWFAQVPDASRSADTSTNSIDATTFVGAAGVAIRTPTIDLETARALIAPLLRASADAPLYPVED
jgi:hypothetical protein